MNRTISPLKAALLGIMLIGLWLIILGIWNALELLYTFRDIPTNAKVTSVIAILIILWKTLPLWIGLVLFRNQRFLVHLFYGQAVTEEYERNHWNDMRFLSTLVLGLLGLFLFARGLDQFCEMYLIFRLIIEIDNPPLQGTQRISVWEPMFWERLSEVMTTLYPVILGLVFALGAGRLGDFMGRQIEKSLEMPPETDDLPQEEENDPA